MCESDVFDDDKVLDSEPLYPAVAAAKTISILPLPYFQLFQASSARMKMYALMGCVTALAVGAAFALLGLLLGQSLDQLIDADDHYSYWEMCRLAIVGAGVGAFALLAGSVSVYCFTIISQDVGNAFRKRCFQSILLKDETYFDLYPRPELAKQLETDCEQISQGTGLPVMISLQVAAYCIVAIGLAALLCLQAALVGVSLVAISLLGCTLKGIVQATEAQKQANAYSKAHNYSLESLKGVKAIAAYNAQSHVSQQYNSTLAQSSSLDFCLSAVKSLGWALGWAGWGISGALLFLISAQWMSHYQANWLLRNTIEGPDIVAIWWLLGTSALCPLALIPGLKAVIQAQYAAGRIDTISQLPIRAISGKLAWEFEGKVEFQDVHFAYPKGPSRAVLTGLSFLCPNGQKTAILGETDSGKSTIASLLLRFYEPSAGLISIDNVPISEIDPSCLRGQVGYLPRNPVLFNLSIEENIHIAAPYASSEEVETAAKEANAFDFIMTLQDGFLTQVSAKGAKLTESQKQRIAIARVTMKKCRIVIVDDATALMDKENEDLVNRTIAALHEKLKVTTIMLSNRVRAIRGAEKIVILCNGKAVEMGTHQELISSNGTYTRLCTLQRLNSFTLPEDSMEEIEVSKGDAESWMLKSRTEETGVMPDVYGLRAAKVLLRQWPLLLVAVILAEIAGLAVLFMAYCVAQMAIYTDDYEGEHMRNRVKGVAIALLIGTAIQALALTLSGWLLGLTITRSIHFLRKTTFQRILHFETAFHEGSNSPESLADHLNSTIGTAYRYYGAIIGAGSICSTLYLGSIVAGLYWQWEFALLFLVLLPVSLVCLGKWSLRQSFNAERSQPAHSIAAESIWHSKTVTADQLQPSLQEIHDRSLSLSVQSSSAAGTDSLWFGLGCAAPFWGFGCTHWLAGLLLSSGSAEQGLVILEVGYCVLVLSLAVTLLSLRNISEGRKAAEKCQEVLSYKPTIDSQETGGLAVPIKGQISFRNVGFKYPKREEWILQKVCLDISAGKCVGLTGASGAGKTTLLQLILRFYDSIEGIITLDGVDIRQYDLTTLRQNIALVPQHPLLFSGSVRANVTLGLAKSDEEVQNALRKAAIPRFAEALDREVGTEGELLSKGQQQRVALARALLRSPAIFLLDEATSALDPHTESQVLKTLEELKQGKTVLVVSHSPTVLEKCEEIWVLDSGSLTSSYNSTSL